MSDECNLCGRPPDARCHQPDYDSDTGPHGFDDGVYPAKAALPDWETAFLAWYPTARVDPATAYRQAFEAGWEAARRTPDAASEREAGPCNGNCLCGRMAMRLAELDDPPTTDAALTYPRERIDLVDSLEDACDERDRARALEHARIIARLHEIRRNHDNDYERSVVQWLTDTLEREGPGGAPSGK